MIQIQQIKLPPGHTQEALEAKIIKILRINPAALKSWKIVKQSIDARKKPEIYFSYVIEADIEMEEHVLKHVRNKQVLSVQPRPYSFQVTGTKKMKSRPIIIGMGPAGLFCAYFLAKHGYRPIVLERGEPVDDRLKSVETFWKNGILNPESNVQFGEGGAGTFSDGKLNTLIKDKFGRNKEVLRILAEAGAPEQILYENKPHVGTDLLIRIVKNIRKQIINWGGEVRFNTKVEDISCKEGGFCSVTLSDGTLLSAQAVVLAIGHSSRDTFHMLHENRIPMEPKSFAVGLRVEHPQKLINLSQYGLETSEFLPAASYKLTTQDSGGRGVYSFCMCPGGYVVNASSENGRLAVNGMSYSGRDSSNANSAVIVSVTPQDFESSHPLAGIEFQRRLEEKAYAAGKGRIPAESYLEFKEHASGFSDDNICIEGMEPCMKGAYTHADVRGILPEQLNEAFLEGIEKFNRIIPGFAGEQVIVSGVESRTSSPVRILRDESGKSPGSCLYPCGEGAGYAGGITSAAMDGIRTAEKIAGEFTPL